MIARILIPVLLSSLIVSCGKKKPSYASSASDNARGVKVSDVALPPNPPGPLLSTDINCEDQAEGEAGHSPGPGINHCKNAYAKVPSKQMQSIGGR